MKNAALLDDLKTLRCHADLTESARTMIENAFFALTPSSAMLVEIGVVTKLSLFRTLALVLKADYERHAKNQEEREQEERERTRREQAFFGRIAPMAEGSQQASPREQWQPWCELARFAALLSVFEHCPSTARLEILIREQWALGVHQLPVQSVSSLAERDQWATALLDAAPLLLQAQFLETKGRWLQQEFQLACLIDLRKELGDSMESARLRFLMVVKNVYPAYVAAAHRLALWKFREHYSDATFTAEEMHQRLIGDLIDSAVDASASVVLEAELESVLLDSVSQLQSDLAAMNHLLGLAQAGMLSPASSAERRTCETLFRKLVRKIHPDALAQHEHYVAISETNKHTLTEIWQQASATYRHRAYLEPGRLLNFVANLTHWHERVDRILRHLTFHAPDRLVDGDNLEEQQDWINRALIEVDCHLHALRDDLAQLQLDPQHQKHLQVLRASTPEQLAECCRMAQQAKAWNGAADQIECAMQTRTAEEARAETAFRKGAHL